MTYREAYEYGRECLRNREIGEADLDARLLLEYVCHTDMNGLLLYGQRILTGEQEKKYTDLIRRRALREPLQYLTGEQEFMGLPFYVDEHVLIPRQDTETLVEEALLKVRDGMSVLDLCTGSGCILISMMKYRKNIRGTAADVSGEALLTARKNALRHGVEKEIKFVEGDLFENMEGRFDVIVSNPPYIPKKVIGTLSPEVREHEPLLALDGREDGLFFYRRIAAGVGRHLTDGGRLFLEIGCEQALAVSSLLLENGFEEIRISRDLAGHERVVSGRRMKLEED